MLVVFYKIIQLYCNILHCNYKDKENMLCYDTIHRYHILPYQH